MSKEKTKVGKWLDKVKGKFPDLLDDVLDVATSGNPVMAIAEKLIPKLKAKGSAEAHELSEEFQIKKMEFEKDIELAYIKTVTNAQDNAMKVDTSENAGWLSKNIHELIAILMTLAWFGLVGLCLNLYLKEKIEIADIGIILVASGVKDMILMIYAFLYGRSKPQA